MAEQRFSKTTKFTKGFLGQEFVLSDDRPTLKGYGTEKRVILTEFLFHFLYYSTNYLGLFLGLTSVFQCFCIDVVSILEYISYLVGRAVIIKSVLFKFFNYFIFFSNNVFIYSTLPYFAQFFSFILFASLMMSFYFLKFLLISIGFLIF